MVLKKLDKTKILMDIDIELKTILLENANWTWNIKKKTVHVYIKLHFNIIFCFSD